MALIVSRLLAPLPKGLARDRIYMVEDSVALVETSTGVFCFQATLMKRDPDLDRYIQLKLTALHEPTSRVETLCPADARVQEFLDAYLANVCPAGAPRLPSKTFVLDRPGIARVLSFPSTKDTFSSPYLHSYRTHQGALHNPKNDRRTTQGVFHIAEGGLPVPDDKIAVPEATFAALLAAALKPPQDVLTLPFTSDQAKQAHEFVSLLMRPIVCPATDRDLEKSMEIRFFAPGTLISNLDFVESIFGNGGDPFLAENNAGLDVSTGPDTLDALFWRLISLV